MTPCCVPIENGKWHVVRGAHSVRWTNISFLLPPQSQISESQLFFKPYSFLTSSYYYIFIHMIINKLCIQ